MTTVVKLTGRGARGESFADIARRVGSAGGAVIPPDATDGQVLDLFGSKVTEDAQAAADLAEAAAAKLTRVQVIGRPTVLDGTVDYDDPANTYSAFALPVAGDGVVRRVRVRSGSAPGTLQVGALSLSGTTWTEVGTWVTVTSSPGGTLNEVSIPVNKGQFLGWKSTVAGRVGGINGAPADSGGRFSGTGSGSFTDGASGLSTQMQIGFDVEITYDGGAEIDRAIRERHRSASPEGTLVRGASKVLTLIDGAVAAKELGQITNHMGNATYKHLDWIDVSRDDAIEITGSNSAVQWLNVWRGRDWEFIGSFHASNGVFRVPPGAYWFSRMMKGAVQTENPGLQIRGCTYSAGDARTVDDDIQAAVEWSTIWDTLNEYTPDQFPGATQTARVMAAVDFINLSGGGKLTLGHDPIDDTSVWELSEAICLGSNFWLHLDNATLKLADGVFDNQIRNLGITPNPAEPFGPASEITQNRNIRVTGSPKVGGDFTAFIVGPDVPYVAVNPATGGDPVPWTGDFFGWRGIQLCFANVRHFEISNIFFKNSTVFCTSFQHGARNGLLKDIRGEGGRKNTNLIDLRNGVSHIRMENISGRTADDLVALVALPGGDIAPPRYMTVTADRRARHEFGDDITDITMKNITGATGFSSLDGEPVEVVTASAHIIRILNANGAKIKRINIDHVEDSENTGTHGRLIGIATGEIYGVAGRLGDLSNISINNAISHHATTLLHLDSPLKDCRFNNIIQNKAGGVTYVDPPVQENVEFTNVVEAP